MEQVHLDEGDEVQIGETVYPVTDTTDTQIYLDGFPFGRSEVTFYLQSDSITFRKV